MNKCATKCKSATENYILKFLTVSSVSSDSIVIGIIDDIINTSVKTAEVDKQKTKYLQHFINNNEQRVPKFFLSYLEFTFVLVLTYYVNRIYL
jgi:urease alpha subunit